MQSLWMLVSGLCFAVMGVFVKVGAAHFSLAELVFYRSLLSMAVSWTVLAHGGFSIRTRRLGMHAHRGISGFVSLFMFFYALSVLPVATAMTLNYTSPVFLAGLLAWFARERLSPPHDRPKEGLLPPGGTARSAKGAHHSIRLLATIVLGFAGVVLLLQPSLQPQQLYAGAIGLASGAISAIAYWNVRALVHADEPEGRVVFYFGFFSCLGALVWMAPQTWTPLTTENWWMLLGVGLTGAFGQLTLTRAYGQGKALVSAALSYSGIVFSSLLGILVWNDVLPWIAWFGIALIIAAGVIAVQLAPASKAEPPIPVIHD